MTESINISTRRINELKPYCDVIIDRWEKFTGEKARRINGKGEDMEKENKAGV